MCSADYLLLLLLLLSSFSRVRLCATPEMAAHQVPLSLGFSRQEHWSGLPFPSPMHACMLSCFSCVRLCETPWTAAHQAPLSTEFSRQEYWSELPFPSPVSGWEAAYQDSGLKVDFFPLPFSTWLLCFSLHFGKDCLSTYKCKQLCSKEPDLLE